MRRSSLYLTSVQLQAQCRAFLLPFLPLRQYKRSCSATLLLGILLCAAAWQASLAFVCNLLRDAPSDQTIRNALHDQLHDYEDLQRRLNRALRVTCQQLRRRKKGYPLAVDLTYLPYYGKNHDDPEVVTNKPKQGTKRFLVYATAYVVWHGERFTLAFTQVEQKESLAAVLKRLLRQARQTGVKWRYVLLDRGFYQVDAIRYLQQAREPFLMPAIVRGRTGATPAECGGTRRFVAPKRSGFYEHRLCTRRRRRATVRICAHAHNHGGKKGQHGRYVWLYAFWGLELRTARAISATYRKRFAIESSYRQLNQGRARTSSKDRCLRLLYVGLALVLRNLWVWWHWEVLSVPRRGQRLLRLELLPLVAYLLRLAEIVQAELGGIKDIDLTPPKFRPQPATR
jgi:putative transposase